MEIRIQAAGASDVGQTRRTNEDAFGFDFERSLFVVCDGVGGANAGEIASRSAVDCMLSRFPLEIPDPNSAGHPIRQSVDFSCLRARPALPWHGDNDRRRTLRRRAYVGGTRG
jgi:serine/threonine protein phosphatase PrpC